VDNPVDKKRPYQSRFFVARGCQKRDFAPWKFCGTSSRGSFRSQKSKGMPRASARVTGGGFGPFQSQRTPRFVVPFARQGRRRPGFEKGIVCSPQAGDKLWRTPCPGGLARASSGLVESPRKWAPVEEAALDASPASWTKAALRWKAPRVQRISSLFAERRVRRPSAPGERVVRTTRSPSRDERAVRSTRVDGTDIDSPRGHSRLQREARCGRPVRAGRTEGPASPMLYSRRARKRALDFRESRARAAGWQVGGEAKAGPMAGGIGFQPIRRPSRDRRCPSGSGRGKALVSMRRPAWRMQHARKGRMPLRRGNARRHPRGRPVAFGHSAPDSRNLGRRRVKASVRAARLGQGWKSRRCSESAVGAAGEAPTSSGGLLQAQRELGVLHRWRDGVACDAVHLRLTEDRRVRGRARGLF
jgi:hypothetical protein